MRIRTATVVLLCASLLGCCLRQLSPEELEKRARAVCEQLGLAHVELVDPPYFDRSTGMQVVRFRASSRSGFLMFKDDVVFLPRVFAYKDGRAIEVTSEYLGETDAATSDAKPAFDLQAFCRPPVLGSGKETAVLVSSPRCPACRAVFSELVRAVKDNGEYALCYLPAGVADRESLTAECLRSKHPDLFWDYLVAVYAGKHEDAEALLVQAGAVCRERPEEELDEKMLIPAVEGIPALLLRDRVLVGTQEIRDWLQGRK